MDNYICIYVPDDATNDEIADIRAEKYQEETMTILDRKLLNRTSARNVAKLIAKHNPQ